MSANKDSFFHTLVDAKNAALIGYSMGGYGAVIMAGGGVTQMSVDYKKGVPHGLLGVHKSASESHSLMPDPRLKTVVAFAPWGMNLGFWDSETLLGVKVPMLFVAGSEDDVSGYDLGVRAIWQATTSVDRALLTFENANHSAGAPMPAPQESYFFDEKLGFNISEHYTDSVWDNVRMNNISQHFVTAWLGKYLKTNSNMDTYLDLVPNSNNGEWAKDADGKQKPEHSHWKGFPRRTAKGLHFEKLAAGE